MFISFEGGDGSGKSTQAKLLKAHFESIGKQVILTREPGGTDLAEKLRSIVLSDKGIMDPIIELLVISAARRDHVENLIKPALTEGKIVISDRFFDSSFVYQGYLKGLALSKIEEITKAAIGDFAPQITFLLDLNSKVAIKRVGLRKNINFYDAQSIEGFDKIRNGFLELATRYNERIKIIDAAVDEEIIAQQIKLFFKE